MSNKGQKVINIFSPPDEAKIIGLGLARIIEDFNDVKKDPSIPWTPEARKDMDTMYKHAKNAAAKLEKFTGVKCDLPPYQQGDEKYFSLRNLKRPGYDPGKENDRKENYIRL